MTRIRLATFSAMFGMLAVWLPALPGSGLAATVTVMVTDDVGRLLPDAVVMITPEHGTPAPKPEASRIAAAVIDQKDETFVPSVVVIHTGGTVTFRNSDRIKHHVYSFSPLRRFEMVEPAGETSPPVRFDLPGSVAIGCNIHDHMIAYVYVTNAPWAMVTDAGGRAVIADIPAGRFVATVWHPRLKPTAEPPALPVVLASENSTLSVTIPVFPPRRARGPDY